VVVALLALRREVPAPLKQLSEPVTKEPLFSFSLEVATVPQFSPT
jgi:hypothetical protein